LAVFGAIIISGRDEEGEAAWVYFTDFILSNSDEPF
jgi:hypothetical protein